MGSKGSRAQSPSRREPAGGSPAARKRNFSLVELFLNSLPSPCPCWQATGETGEPGKACRSCPPPANKQRVCAPQREWRDCGDRVPVRGHAASPVADSIVAPV